MSTASVKAVAVLLSLLAGSGSAEPLRAVHDAARNRIWLLEADGVYLQEGARKTRFELPGWVYLSDAYACSPDLVLDAQGAAVVTSNVVPILWRIDPMLRRAQKIPVSAPLRDACGLAVERTKTRRTVVLCAQDRAVHLAPDQRSGYVFARPCGQDSSL